MCISLSRTVFGRFNKQQSHTTLPLNCTVTEYQLCSRWKCCLTWWNLVLALNNIFIPWLLVINGFMKVLFIKLFWENIKHCASVFDQCGNIRSFALPCVFSGKIWLALWFLLRLQTVFSPGFIRERKHFLQWVHSHYRKQALWSSADILGEQMGIHFWSKSIL